MNLLEAIIAGKLEGGPGGEVTPSSVVNATANMTDEQKTDTKTNLGVVDATAANVVSATAAMTPEQAAQTMQNLGVPVVSSADNGKFMKVVDGQWAAVTVPEAAGGDF